MLTERTTRTLCRSFAAPPKVHSLVGKMSERLPQIDYLFTKLLLHSKSGVIRRLIYAFQCLEHWSCSVEPASVPIKIAPTQSRRMSKAQGTVTVRGTAMMHVLRANGPHGDLILQNILCGPVDYRY